MELSQAFQKQAKKMNATPQYVLLADLMSIGYSEIDAYTIAYPENEALSAQQNKGIRENILSSAKFKKVFEERCSHIKSGVAMPIPVEEVELVGTEEVMKEILRSAKQQPVGSKDRADLFAKYNEIKTKNDMGAENGNDNISFFFPLKCNMCPLLYAYNDYVGKNGGGELKPVEMERVMRLSRTIIKAATDAE